MKRVISALILAPLVFAAVLWLKPWVFSIAVGFVALIAADEFLNISQAAGFPPARYVTMFFVALLFVAFPLRSSGWFSEAQWTRISGGMFWGVQRFPQLLIAIIIATTFFALLFAMRRHGGQAVDEDLHTAFAGAAVSVLAIPYIALTLGSLVLLKTLAFGPFLLIYLFIVVWSGDIFAYYAGRTFGRHHLAPRISPKKTWEGAAASFVSSIILGTLWFSFAAPITAWMAKINAVQFGTAEPRALWRIAALCAVLNIVAQLGDLFESFIKRAAGVKDSGTIIPGHGGLLDRIDALLFAAPLLWWYALLTNL